MAPFLRATFACALALAAAPAFAQSPAPLIGALESVSASAAGGWACVPGSGSQVSIAFYAGAHLVGVYPATGNRPDTAGTCGADAASAGFSIAITPLVAQQFLNQSSLRFVAVAGQQSLLLPPAAAGVADPYPLSGGLLTSLSAQGSLSGSIYPAGPSAGLPVITILEGGPPGSGGQAVASAVPQGATGAGGPAGFSLALPPGLFENLPPDYALSLFASAVPTSGPPVQLGSPVIPSAAYLNLATRMAQSGALSGITNTLYTRWVSGRMVFSGLAGGISLSGSDPSFSEALVTFGFTGDSQAACQKRNGTSPAKLPPFTRLAGFILKDDAVGGDTLPISLALPYGVGLGPGDGVCLLTWISAGYPWLVPIAAKYDTVGVAVAMAVSPRAASMPVVIPEGLGGEFSFHAGTMAGLYTVIALRANVDLALDEISGSVSAGGVLGAPAGSGQAPPPASGWTARTQFFQIAPQDCAALGLTFGHGNAYFSVAANHEPLPYALPGGSAPIVDVPLYGLGANVTQQSFFQSFPAPGAAGTSSVLLQPGDCLVAFHEASGAAGALDGVLDMENQSTVYLRAVK